MIALVTYADSRMTTSQDRCAESARKHGVDVCRNYNSVSDEFYEMNKDVLYQERGAGYWLWKPYVIYCELLKLNEGDVLIYADAGVEFVNSVHEIISRMDEDIFFFTNGWPHVEWCKMDCIDAIHPGLFCEKDLFQAYSRQKQVQASVIFFKVNQKTRDFVKEWLLYCQMPGFIDDSPSKLQNYPTFAEHRHDQAILTCLQIKYGYKLHWWPTQYSYHLERTDEYPVMFNHHRKRNGEW